MKKQEQTLESSNAHANVNQDLGLTIWQNQYDTVSYQRTSQHTLSLYIDGGQQTRRLDRAIDTLGGPNKLCLMPAGARSTWQVKKPQRFAHMYFSKHYFTELLLQEFDVDPRSLELEEKTFFTDPNLANRIKALLGQHSNRAHKHPKGTRDSTHHHHRFSSLPL